MTRKSAQIQSTKKVKIVHLISSGGLYGAEKWIYALMRAMDIEKFTNVLINLFDQKEGQSAVVIGAKDRELAARDIKTEGRFNPFAIYRLARWLKINDVDIVHGHGYKSDLLGLVAGRLAGCKVITTPHGWSKEDDKKLMFYEALDRFIFRYMDYVCPLSEDLQDSVRDHVRFDKLKLILNGVDIDEVVSQPAFAPESSRRFRIGYVGQLIERKDLKTLLFAFKELLNQTKEVELVIVGDGPLRQDLERLAADLKIDGFTQFMGYRTDALTILKSFDVFVLPSLLEGIPRCLMETMAAEVLVVASNIPGNRDLVVHGETGWLFSAGDKDDLCKTLAKVISSKSGTNRIKVAAKQMISDKYSNRRVAREYEALYLDLHNFEDGIVR